MMRKIGEIAKKIEERKKAIYRDNLMFSMKS